MFQFQKSFETKEDVYVKEAYQNFADYGFRGSSSIVSHLNNQTPKDDDDDDDDDCAIISMSPGELTEPPHRRLYADRERRNSKISHLGWLVSLLNARLRSGRSKPLVKLGLSVRKAESRKKVEELGEAKKLAFETPKEANQNFADYGFRGSSSMVSDLSDYDCAIILMSLRS